MKILVTSTHKIETSEGYFPGNSVEVLDGSELIEGVKIPFTGPLRRTLDRDAIDVQVREFKSNYPKAELQDNLNQTGQYWDEIRAHQKRRDAFIGKNGYVYRTDLPRSK